MRTFEAFVLLILPSLVIISSFIYLVLALIFSSADLTKVINKTHYYLSPLLIWTISICILFGGLLSWLGIIFLAISLYEMSKHNLYEEIKNDSFWSIVYALMGVIALLFSIFIIGWRINSFNVLGGELGMLVMDIGAAFGLPGVIMVTEGITGMNLTGCLLSSIYIIHRSLQTIIQSRRPFTRISNVS